MYLARSRCQFSIVYLVSYVKIKVNKYKSVFYLSTLVLSTNIRNRLKIGNRSERAISTRQTDSAAGGHDVDDCRVVKHIGHPYLSKNVGHPYLIEMRYREM